GQHYALWMQSKGYENWRDYFRPNAPRLCVDDDPHAQSTHEARTPGQAWEIPAEIHYNTWISERTNALMDQYAEAGDHFFLWASFFDPHPQYMVPEPYASMYDPAAVTVPEFVEGEFDDKPPYFKLSQERKPDFSAFQEPEGNSVHGGGCHLRSREIKAKHIATMYGMMTMLDEHVGRIIDNLERLGLAESTLVCFTTDHGDFWGQHGLTAKAIHHYEDLLRVPLVLSMPGTVPSGVISDSLQSTVDLSQTFLSVAGLAVPRTMSGVDQKAVWFGEVEGLRDHVIVENQHQPTTMNMRTYIDQRYKMTVHYNREYGELYDLQEDPGEYRNLWDLPDCAALKTEMLLKFLYGEMAKAPLPMPRIVGA
ncbi:MAG: sulfatase-like hydrolase/transferase, partial [Lentisphaeria bacterium]|nr:sulfatase-like hydrolase/transferase [Lentisphaeria bacterium]